jgi:hypothetical protein
VLPVCVPGAERERVCGLDLLLQGQRVQRAASPDAATRCDAAKLRQRSSGIRAGKQGRRPIDVHARHLPAGRRRANRHHDAGRTVDILLPAVVPSRGVKHSRRILVVAALAVLLLPECIVWERAPGSSGTPGSGGGTAGGSGGESSTTCLREPDVGGTSPRALSPDEQAREAEVCQYLADRYQQEGWNILFTAQMPSGDIYDWLDPATVAGSQEEPPPPLSDEVLPAPGFNLAKLELDLFPEFRGPDGTMPVVRPSFSRYIRGDTAATSIEDFIDNFQVTGTPDGGNRLYAGISSVGDPKDPKTFTSNLGASAWVTAFSGPIEPGTMSLLEMAIGCRNLATGEMEQQIGIAAVRDYANTTFNNSGDSVLRLQVEFLKHGAGWTGEGKGGWVGTVTSDFHPYQNKASPLGPGMALAPSAANGLPSGSLFWIRLWKGNWWVGWNGIWLGHYDGALFGSDDLFATNACEALWYGEVYDPNATPTTWTATNMGSGQFANDALGNAASFINPFYLDMLESPQWPDHGSLMPSRDDKCYTTSDLFVGVAPLYRWFYLGGPGGDAPNHDCPENQQNP